MSSVDVNALSNLSVNVYKAIDTRLAQAKVDGNWIPIFSVIRLSRLTVDAIREKHTTLIKRWGEVRTSSFAISLEQQEFSTQEWSSLTQDLNNAIVGKEGFLRPESSARQTIGSENEWPAIAAFMPIERVEGVSCADLLTQVRAQFPLGRFPTLDDALKVLMDTGVETSNASLGSYVHIPLYAKIDSYDLSGADLDLSVSLDPALEPLEASVVQRDREQRLKFSEPLRVQSQAGQTQLEGVTTWKKSVSLHDVDFYDKVQIRLWHLASQIEIDSREVNIGPLLSRKEAVDYPLINLLPRFCSWDDLESLLLATDAVKHEHAVSTLLSLLGFETILLGKAGHARFDNDPQVTVDVLAYRRVPPHTIFLIACKTGNPPTGTFDTLIRAKDAISNFFVGKDLYLKLVLFCSISVPVAKSLGCDHGVTVVDATDIPKIVGALKNNDPNRALNEYSLI